MGAANVALRPVAIVQHAAGEGPAYFADWLDQQSQPWQCIALDTGASLPRDPQAFSGLVFMGGAMSVNDPLPWIDRALRLIRACVAHDVPVLGHCLGGQLMAKAFGGVVQANPVKEIGWAPVLIEDNGVARHWFGETQRVEAFHWHGETFSVPPGGTRLAHSAHCANQAFSIGKHLGLQCHIEMNAQMVHDWCEAGRDEMQAASTSPAVQSATQMQRDLDARIAALHALADRIYRVWLSGLRLD